MSQYDDCGFDHALKMILEHASPIKRVEMVMLDKALGKVIAHDVVCRKNMPAFDNSAMDGFAVRHTDGGQWVSVIGTLHAGDIPQMQVEAGEAVRIMTGAQVPVGIDTIVPIETIVDATEEAVKLPESIKRGDNLRHRGEEQKEGAVLFAAGTRLTPPHIAMLSAQGIVAVEVMAPLRIAVVSSGNEIREPWEVSTDDEIYNANAFGIVALLRQYGFESTYVGAIPDDPVATRNRVADLKHYDVIISTGGISMGEADFLYQAYLDNGMEPIVRGVNIKPGHPVTMGVMGETFVMAMPGNPLATMVTTLLLGVPVLFRLQGAARWHHAYVAATNSLDFQARPGRTNLVLGEIKNGVFYVTRNNQYGSGMITPLVESNAVAVLGERRNGVKAGEMLKVILIGHSIMSNKPKAVNEER